MRANGVFDIKSFCESHRISRSFLYKLIAEGRGPRLMKLGRRTLISIEAAAEWRARMEVESPQPMDAAQN
jgi:predicted DNA-binding transcriptional regulator AlpA